LLEQRTDERFYDRWESTPEVEREHVIRTRLEEYVTFAREHVPCYRERLERYDPKSPHPLAEVPVLHSTEFRQLVPPVSRALCSSRKNDFTVFQSGGTTGIPKSTLFSHAELDGLDLPNARGYFAVGLTAEDRVANFFAVGSLYMTFVHINRMMQQYGCMNFPFSNHCAPDFVHTVTKLFDINCFTGIASVVLGQLRALSELGLEGIRIEKIYYGGERLYDADKEEIRRKFGTEIIHTAGYGTIDSWYIGYQCAQCPTDVLHAHDDQTFIEIVDEETGKHVEPGEPGMLYATAFPRRLTPVVRYRVGDLATWVAEPCACGRTTPRFRLMGRGDDVLRIGYDSVDYNAVQAAVSRVPGLSGTVQMEKEREAGRDRLVLRVETELDEPRFEEARARLHAELVGRRPALREFLQKGTVWPIRIELLTPGAIPRNTRTGKLIRVIDVV
jgi:phenylacetate-coenzyme A ligase PaaK-like adenylate-forming protein